jgi:hypothetical protein
MLIRISGRTLRLEDVKPGDLVIEVEPGDILKVDVPGDSLEVSVSKDCTSVDVEAEDGVNVYGSELDQTKREWVRHWPDSFRLDGGRR